MPKQSRKTNKAAIDVHHLSVSYGENKVLDNISFQIPVGNVAAIIGPNGSGKTTLLKAILGLIDVDQGSISVFGNKLKKQRDLIGYVPQKFEFDLNFPITVEEFMGLASKKSQPALVIEEKIKEVGLTPMILQKQLGELSGGQLQRILIAEALFNEPKILILDEPAAGIDIAGEKMFHDIIDHINKDHDTTVLIVSHDMAFVSKVVDQVICINKTLICSDAPKIAMTEKNLKKVFEDVNLSHHEH